jgi:hypothetical protein
MSAFVLVYTLLHYFVLIFAAICFLTIRNVSKEGHLTIKFCQLEIT